MPVVLGLVQVGLFLEQTGFFLRNGNSSRRTSLLLWILGVYPVRLGEEATLFYLAVLTSDSKAAVLNSS